MMHTYNETRANGFAFSTAPTSGESDWRQHAMNRMLRSASEDGTPIHLLLEAIQEHAPGSAVHTFYQDRGDVARTLPRIGTVRPILTPAYEMTDDILEVTEPRPVYSWCAVTTPSGDTVELVGAPCLMDSNYFAVFGPSDAVCLEFTRRLLKEISAVHHRCRRFLATWKDDPELEAESSKISWDDIILAPDQLADIRRTIDQFFVSKDVFHSIGFPWRRGVLLVGPPGTGKTMVCKAAASAHKEVPFLYVGEVRHNGSLQQIFKHARESAPCILAFEDLDSMLDHSNRTFFLNELDGFRNNDGILIIASSNHPERIDEALLKRPSRFDRVYHIGLPARRERAAYCRHFLSKLPNLAPDFDIEALTETVAQFTEGFTPAFLKEAFLAAMLQLAHEGHTTLDMAYHNAVCEQVETLRKYLKKAKKPDAMADMISSADDAIGFRNRRESSYDDYDD